MTRVIMLNDYPCAVCTDDRLSDEALLARGEREAETRYGPRPARKIYVHIHAVPDWAQTMRAVND